MNALSPLRVAFYQSSPQHLYGGQIDLLRFFEACDRTAIAPVVIVPADGPFVERARALNLPVHVLPLPSELAQTGGALLYGNALDRARQVAQLTPWNLNLARLLRQIDAQVLYANNRRAVLTVGMGARRAGVPVFWHIKQDAGRGRMDDIAIRLATYGAGCSLDVTEAFRQRHPRHADKIGYVPYGIPLAPFAAPGPNLRLQLGIPSDALVVGQVGSITPRKGVDLFVAVALRLAALDPDRHFVLAGDAPEAYVGFKEEVLARAQPLIAAGRFHALGFHDNMPAVYRTLDLLLLPSRIEGFGLVIAEAGAAGVPAIRTASGGHSESTIDNETGFVTPIDDEEKLLACSQWLLTHDTERKQMGAKARDHAFTHFGIERFVAGLSDALYETARRGGAVPTQRGGARQ